MNAPRYAVYFMLDEPKGNASTGGYSTAGAVSAPGAGRVIARIGPMLGLMPDTANAAAINASLAIPMTPSRPANWREPPRAQSRQLGIGSSVTASAAGFVRSACLVRAAAASCPSPHPRASSS